MDLKFVCAGLWTTALQPLLAWAEAVIPHSHWEATPLFLFGTAGLRVLSPDSQSRLLVNIRTALQGSSFRCDHSCCRQQCGTCIDRCAPCPREQERKRNVVAVRRHDGLLWLCTCNIFFFCDIFLHQMGKTMYRLVCNHIMGASVPRSSPRPKRC